MTTPSSETLADSLRQFGETVRGEIPALLRHYQATLPDGRIGYVNQPGDPYRVRPWCDAVEIAAAFGSIPEIMSREKWIAALRGFQDPKTTLVPELVPGVGEKQKPAPKPEHEERYNTMIVNYALECLGTSLAHPVTNAEEIDAELLVQVLKNLNWASEAWGAGHWIDGYASCLCANRKYFGQGRQVDALFSWLDAHGDSKSGLWGQWREKDRWLQPVNGFYRLTRGTYAQFGRALPHPVAAIDTLFIHMADAEVFGAGQGNACNVLDVVHPLWLCLKQTDHRRVEVEAWMRARLPVAMSRWNKEQGMAFDPAGGASSWEKPALQGTEMWLAIIYLMADLLGLADRLGYRPTGVHRLERALGEA